MYFRDHGNFMDTAQQALNQPIRTRCGELTALFERSSLSELHHFFPMLINSIFGIHQSSWGLRMYTHIDGEIFRQLHEFLSPSGPLFNLIYVLLKDPANLYNYTLNIPTNIREMLERSRNHTFISTDLFAIEPQTKSSSFALNAFDYYILHFAYHLIDPAHKQKSLNDDEWNTIYYTLCCDYILYFLPIDPDAKILPEINFSGPNPTKQITTSINIRETEQNIGKLGLIKPLNKSSLNQNTSIRSDKYQPSNYIWRTDTVFTVFTDMWLCNDFVIQPIITRYNTSPYNKNLHYNELPSEEYMRIVRVLIKQLHSFSDSAKCDDTDMAEIKKAAIPLIQVKFYLFLKSLIHRWPLDGSFRLVLELWLTYIQPWRYPGVIPMMNRNQINFESDDIRLNNNFDRQSLTPTAEHLPFIIDNFLCYVAILKQLLPRFARADLVSPRMAMMLYRIAKVFDQGDLPIYLKELETLLDNDSRDVQQKYTSWDNIVPHLTPNQTNWTLNSSQLNISNRSNRSFSPFLENSSQFNDSSSSNINKKWLSALKQKIHELEGPYYHVDRLFSRSAANYEIYNLLVLIKSCIKEARNVVKAREEEEEKLYSGFWGTLKYFFQLIETNDEFKLSDRKKVPFYLEVVFYNFKNIFDIKDEIPEDEIDAQANLSSAVNDGELDYQYLSPAKVRSRLKTLSFEGDPDLLPVAGYECGFLVKILYNLSTKINEMYGLKLRQLYFQSSFTGKLCRQLLRAPMVTYKYTKTRTVGRSQRLSSHLPPRVSLRLFANYRFWSGLIFGAMLAKLLNFNITTYLLFLFVIFLGYKILKSLFSDDRQLLRHNYPIQGFGNITFNDSF